MSRVVVWSNLILHVTFCHAMQRFMYRAPDAFDGDDDAGRESLHTGRKYRFENSFV